MKRTRKKRETRSLILGYLERVSATVFSDYPEQLTDLVGKQQGVYALYKGERLYYVGLASNLRRRIKQHLKDRHAGKWHKFSLYLIRKEDHVKELESLVLRIANPKGNVSAGRLTKAENLRSQLKTKILAKQKQDIEDTLGPKRTARRKTSKTKPNIASRRKRQPALKGYISKSFRIRGTRKGKLYRAQVRGSGVIYYEGKPYKTPSMAAKAALGIVRNGWQFWKYKTKPDNWVPLSNLKKR